MDSQVGDQNTRDARTVRPLLQAPLLALDAVLLTIASADWYSLLQAGPISVNMGHVGLAATTVGMAMFFKKFPQALQPILTRYQKWKARRASKEK